MEDMIKALLDVVRAQHSAAEGTEESSFGIDDVVDMAINIMGRPDEEEMGTMVDSIRDMVERLAPDIFPPKTFEQMDEEEKAVSAANMIEESLLRGRNSRRTPEAQPKEETMPDLELTSGGQEEETADMDDAGEAADLNDLIYKNLMQMMGLQNPQVEYPFDRSQLRYGREKTMTEILEEERRANQEEEERGKTEKRQLSAWELAQAAVDEEEAAHEKEPYIPPVMEETKTKSASQLAAEAIRRSQEEDRQKLEIEKQAERLMEEAKKRGQDPMKFALHQQEILRYMEKNSEELVSFEDYEDLSPEEKLEMERQIYVEKQLAKGVAPDEVDTQVPEEYIPRELKETLDLTAPVDRGESVTEKREVPVVEEGTKAPGMTEEMLRQLSREVVKENSSMILSDNTDANMDNIQEMIFQNIKEMMQGSGAPVGQEDVDSLLEQAAMSAKGEPQAPAPEENARKHAPLQKEEAGKVEGLSAVELAKAAQKAAALRAKEGQKTEEMPAAEPSREIGKTAEPEMKESEAEGMLVAEPLGETEEDGKPEAKEGKMEGMSVVKSGGEMPEEVSFAEASILEGGLPEDEDLEEEEDDFEYVAPGELVLGNHTQAEVDEALENLDSLGLEGDVLERAKRMLLLELAGSEAELEAWLQEQEQGKKKKAAVSALDEEEKLELEEFDEDSLEKELELALDEDFLEEDLQEEATLSKEQESEEKSEEETVGGSEEKKEGESGRKSEEKATEESEEKKEAEVGEKSEEGTAEGSEEKEKVAACQDVLKEEDTMETMKEERQEPEAKSYQVSVKRPFVLKNSASFMDRFEDYIVDIQENRKLSTGFRRLDGMLRYGLHKGSYFVDARPQFLKNSFMLQMADRAAESGVDVLYISTELSRYDLMVESVSRLSYEIHQKDVKKAVSVMSIMTGEEGADLASLKDELNWYRGRISEHLYILDQEAVMDYTDDMEEASAGDILEGLIRSIVKDGVHKPAVFIDNIENILSVEDSEDMAPLMDGIRRLAKDLGIPIVLSYGYAQAETEAELSSEEQNLHRSLGHMCDVYMELKFAETITEDSMELTEGEMKELAEEGKTLLIDVLLHKNRRALKASCQIQGTPKYNHYEE
ncbi:MAG: DnaB-like helicase C-terminal domain-containing protein [Eubacteriales bacterium]|nr:DnaB-like helicase C-terminal domain-containing protein [Eubacteriales bacterium]